MPSSYPIKRLATEVAKLVSRPATVVKVTVNADEVVIQQGDKKVIVPRRVHDAMREVEKSSEFRQGVADAFEAVDRDTAVTSLGISQSMDDPAPVLKVPRERFADVAKTLADNRRDEAKEVIEQADLQIIWAILKRKRRRWEFAWRGILISAPQDDAFNAQFLARKIPLHPGDGLQVMLRMRRHRDSLSGVMVNDPTGYELVKVLKHIPGQSPLDGR